MVALVDAMGAGWAARRKAEHEAAREAARLAKADLTTLMVREFPELQGVMGGIYLRRRGRARGDVAARGALALPPASRSRRAARPPARSPARDATRLRGRVAGGQARHAGRLLRPRPRAHRAAAIPSACAARRRASSACCSTSGRPTAPSGRPSLRRLVAAAVAGYGGRPEAPGATTSRATWRRFLLDRLRYVLGRARLPGRRGGGGARRARAGRPRRSARGRAAAAGAAPRAARRRARTSTHLAVAFKRAKNILGDQAPPAPVDPALFEEAAERELHEAVRTLAGSERRLRGAAALAGRPARPGGPLLRRRARDGRGPEGAREPPRPALAGAVALLPHRGHLEARRLSLTQYVYFFGGGKADGNKDMKDTARRQGRRPGRDDERRPARAARASPSPPPPATSSWSATGSLPAEIDAGDRAARCERLETLMGKQLGDARRPAAGLRAQRRQVLHARDDGHHPEPGPERPLGGGPEGQDRQRPLRQGLLPPLHPDVRQRGARHRQGRASSTSCSAVKKKKQGQGRRGPRRGGARRGDRALQGGRAEGDGQATSRRTRASSSRARATPSSSPG